jgi:HlyD family secretion protein
MKKRIRIVLLLVVVSLVVYFLWRKENKPFVYAGTVEATEVDVSSQVASTIGRLGAEEGQAVTLGQALAVLDGQDYKLAQSLANDDYSRGLKLFRSGSMPQENFNHLKTQKELADLRVQWCNVTSPISGRVLTRYHEAGEWVNPGTKLFTLADLGKVWAYFYVPQPLLGKLSYGQKVTGFTAEDKGRTFEGTITHINQEAEFTPKNVQTEKERTRLVFAVKVTFPNPDGVLKPGMTLEAKLP